MGDHRKVGIGPVALGASVALAGSILKLRPRLQHWGATATEAAEVLPGDDLVPGRRYETTRAITIQSPPATVWAWLVQIGQGRGGFYSFDRLENLAGMTIDSADRILPELQQLAVGDIVPLSDLGGPTVAILDPGAAMVLHLVMDPITAVPIDRAAPGVDRWFDWTWQFVLRPLAGGGTRLVVRVRADWAPPLLTPLVALLVEPIHLLMERQMLRGIRRRAESTTRSPPGLAGRAAA